jgi:hypothetical protein
VRRRRSTEQRLWLGPGGYLSGGRRPIAYAHGDANCNCYGNRTSKSVAYAERRGTFAHSDTYGDSYSDGDAKGGAKASAHAAPSANAVVGRSEKSLVISEAETCEVP